LIAISPRREEDEAEGLRALPWDFLLVGDEFLLDEIATGGVSLGDGGMAR